MTVMFIHPTTTTAVAQWNCATYLLQSKTGKWLWQQHMLPQPFLVQPYIGSLRKRHTGKVELSHISLLSEGKLEAKSYSRSSMPACLQCRQVQLSPAATFQFAFEMSHENRGMRDSFTLNSGGANIVVLTMWQPWQILATPQLRSTTLVLHTSIGSKHIFMAENPLSEMYLKTNTTMLERCQ